VDFDVTFDVVHLEYGIVWGNHKIVLIKSGKGGSCRGYGDKYMKMARLLHDQRGYTVICSSNPIECKQSLDIDRSVIERVALEAGLGDFELYLVGFSNGAYQNLFLANQIPQTQKVLSVNMPLMLNYHKITRELQAMDTVEKIFVYGTEDPSIDYLPFLEGKKYPLLRAIRIHGADHQFSDKTEELIALANLL